MTVTEPRVRPSRVAVDTVLVPVDFSPLSWQVLPLARHVARSLGASVTSVHVDTASPWRDDASAATLRLRVTPYGRRTDVLVTANRDPVDGILHMAGSTPDTLIAMSSHGHSGLGELALGSVCEGVLRSYDQPVLVTGPHFDVARHASVRRIVAAVDLTPGGDRILADALGWGQALDVPVELVTVIPRHLAPDQAVGDEALRFTHLVDSLAEREDRVTGLVLEGPRPAHEIVKYAGAVRGTLLAMATHALPPLSRTVVGSTVMSVVRHAPTGVLIRRRGEAL